MKTLADWNHLSRKVMKGQKAQSWTKQGIALFKESQTVSVARQSKRGWTPQNNYSHSYNEGYEYEGSWEETLGGDFY